MRSAVVAALAAALTPVGHAQAGCGALNQILDAAPDSFGPIWGEEIDDDYFRPTVWLERGAVGCYVDLTLRDTYSCLWNFSAEADANAKFAALTGAARMCLAGWQEKDQAGKTAPMGTPMIKGLAFGAGPGVHAETVAAFYTSSVAADRHSVTFEVLRLD